MGGGSKRKKGAKNGEKWRNREREKGGERLKWEFESWPERGKETVRKGIVRWGRYVGALWNEKGRRLNNRMAQLGNWQVQVSTMVDRNKALHRERER